MPNWLATIVAYAIAGALVAACVLLWVFAIVFIGGVFSG